MTYDIWEILLTFGFLGVPTAIIIWFIVSLILYIRTPKNSEKYKTRKLLLILSLVATGLLVLAVLALMILMLLALTYM